MKELQGYEVVEEILKKQDTCGVRDMNEFKAAYEKKHPDTYVCVTRDDIYHIMSVYKDVFYWDNKREVFIKQHEIKCPVCGDTHYKFPNEEKFKKILTEKTTGFTVEEMKDAFLAGLNRGVFVASALRREPIDGDYPTYEEYMKKYNKPC
jgi:hypothetical protein